MSPELLFWYGLALKMAMTAAVVVVTSVVVARSGPFLGALIASLPTAAGAVGFDEIHGYKNWDLMEALTPDPTRADALQWVTSYDTILNVPGIPLFDLKEIGKAGSDPRMVFSWYSGGDLCTDPAFAELEPELRANPSIDSWPEGRDYIEQQRRRLPTHKFRRLHLNLPGAPSGAYFDQGKVLAVIVPGRPSLPYQEGFTYFAFVDMSGGSSDDAVLAIGHFHEGYAIIDRIEKQAGGTPFNPRMAVTKFAAILREYHLSSVMGDNYAGLTFKADFEALGISYGKCPWTKSELYEALEVAINAAEVELLDEQAAGTAHLPGDTRHQDRSRAERAR
jgi:hypothetical protein